MAVVDKSEIENFIVYNVKMYGIQQTVEMLDNYHDNILKSKIENKSEVFQFLFYSVKKLQVISPHCIQHLNKNNIVNVHQFCEYINTIYYTGGVHKVIDHLDQAYIYISMIRHPYKNNMLKLIQEIKKLIFNQDILNKSKHKKSVVSINGTIQQQEIPTAIEFENSEEFSKFIVGFLLGSNCGILPRKAIGCAVDAWSTEFKYDVTDPIRNETIEKVFALYNRLYKMTKN